MEDRRQSVRIRVQFNITMSFSGGQSAGEGHLINLSPAGAALRSEKRLAKGDFLSLQIYPPSSASPIKVETAVVRWIEGQDAGLEFLKIRPEEQQRFAQLLKPLLEALPDKEKARAAQLTERAQASRAQELERKEQEKSKVVEWFD